MTRRPCALILEPAGNLWGSEKALLDFVGEMGNNGWTVEVCCPPGTPIIPELERRGIAVHGVFRANLHRASRLPRLVVSLRLMWVILRCRPSVIHVNQAGATKIALFASWLAGVPVVPHVRLAEDVAYLERLGPSRKRVPVIICISGYIRSLFSSLQDRTRTLYDSYTLAPRGSAHASETGTGTFLLTCVGRMVPVKGQDVLVRAMEVLIRAGLNPRVHLVGAERNADAFGRSVSALARELDVERYIIWEGFKADPQPLVGRAVAAVCCSHVEPLGRTIFEAWDAGTVPVAFAGSGGAAEVILASGGGVVYDRQDGKSLAATLIALHDMPQAERWRMVERGRAWMRANTDRAEYAAAIAHSWERAAGVQRT